MSARSLGAVAMTGAAVVVVLVGTGLGWWSSAPATRPPARPLAVRTSIAPIPAFFADPVVAQVAVDLDSDVVSPESVRVHPSFAPYIEAGPPTVVRSRFGRRETLVFRYELQCVTEACLPAGRPHPVRLPPVSVTAAAGTERLTASGSWPSTVVASRLQPSDLARAALHFRRPAVLPPASFGVSPGLLADGLTAATGVLGAVALLLVGVELARLVANRRRLGEPTPLERALASVRQAARRPEASDRRKALELLAETLAMEGRTAMADKARAAAWAERPPSAEHALAVADEAEAF